MSNKILVSVMAAGCLSRFRNGLQFTKTPKEIKVDEHQLAILQADSYLKVKVLSDDANNDADNGSDGLAVDANTEANAGADTDKDDANHTDATEGSTVSEESGKRLNVIVKAMRDLKLVEKPTVHQLRLLGLDVSAKERDDAWDVLTAESEA